MAAASAPLPVATGAALALLLLGLLLARVPERPGPAATIQVDLAQPTHLQVGDADFAVTIALQPVATVPDWWWCGNGGVVAIRLAGRDLLTPRGMPERWDLEEFEAPEEDLRLRFGQGWQRKGEQARVLPSQVLIADGAITCIQELPERGGWAYRLARTFRVHPHRRELVVDIALSNTGNRPLTVRHFVHAYWNLGGGPIDGRYRIDTALRPQPGPELWCEGDESIRIAAPIAKATIARERVQDPGTPAAWRLVNEATGLAVAICGDFAPALFALYAEAQAIVPELSGRWRIAPGTTARWQRRWRCTATRP